MLIQDILKAYRTNHNFTQEKIAEKLHVSTQAVSKWENGKSIPSIDNLLLLSDLYNVSIDELVQGSPYFKKPRVVGQNFDLKKGIFFMITWTFISLLFTGFGSRLVLLFPFVLLIGIVIVFPTIFSDYWVINQTTLDLYFFSQNPFLKFFEIVNHKKQQKKISYMNIESIEIIYKNRTRFSAFDLNPDYFYLVVHSQNKTVKLNLDHSAKMFLPQFIAFLARKGIHVIDSLNIIELFVSNTSLYDHFNQRQNN